MRAYTYVCNKTCSYSVSDGTEVHNGAGETTLKGQSVDQGCNFKGAERNTSFDYVFDDYLFSTLLSGKLPIKGLWPGCLSLSPSV